MGFRLSHQYDFTRFEALRLITLDHLHEVFLTIQEGVEIDLLGVQVDGQAGTCVHDITQALYRLYIIRHHDIIRVSRRGGEDEFDLVGTTEANPKEGRISDHSPIGKALIGASVGDTVTADTPSGQIKLKVLEIGRT